MVYQKFSPKYFFFLFSQKRKRAEEEFTKGSMDKGRKMRERKSKGWIGERKRASKVERKEKKKSKWFVTKRSCSPETGEAHCLVHPARHYTRKKNTPPKPTLSTFNHQPQDPLSSSNEQQSSSSLSLLRRNERASKKKKRKGFVQLGCTKKKKKKERGLLS